MRSTLNLNNKSMSLFEHLFELRGRLIFCLLVFVLAWGVSWIFSSKLLEWIAAPAAPHLSTQKLIFTAPMDEFLAHLKASAFGALMLGCPFFIYQGWSFIAPGLYKSEKKIIILFSFLELFFFFLECCLFILLCILCLFAFYLI